MQGNVTAKTPSGEGYIPPKMWRDLTSDEKIERMRETIKSLQYVIGELQRKSQNAINDFQNHEHLNGKIVKDIKTYNSEFSSTLISSQEKEESGEVYF